MNGSLNILLLSSRMPSHSADYGRDLITSLTNAGHHVQFGFDGIEDYITKCTRPPKKNLLSRVLYKVHFYLRKYFNGLSEMIPLRSSWVRNGIMIYNPYEEHPPLSEEVVVNKLSGDFDICVVLFYHNMFTAKTYKAIYEKFHIPLILIAIDMTPLTGGCYYFGNCKNYENECGNCPVCGGRNKNDRTHKNFKYKKGVYESIECVLFANTWVLRFVQNSGIISMNKTKCMNLVLDENEFVPRNILACRQRFNILANKKYIFLSRYRTIARKGMDVLVNGVNGLYESLPDEEKNNALLILIGQKADNLHEVFQMDVMQLGFVNKDSLIDLYNASTAFLCSSTEDAGPSMINQSMACGTPVVAFDIGCSIDMIDDGVNGYKTSIDEMDKWGDGLKKLCSLSEVEYAAMRKKAREKAVEINGLRTFSKAVEDAYMSFRPNGKK